MDRELALGEIAFDREALTVVGSDSMIRWRSPLSRPPKRFSEAAEAAGDRPVYNINVTSGKKNISEFAKDHHFVAI